MFITNTRSGYLAGDEPRRAMVGVAVSFTVDRCHVHQDQVTSVGVDARETHTHRRKHPSAAQSTAVHDGRLHPHLRHCSSAASAGWQVTLYHSTRRTGRDGCIHTSDIARRQHLRSAGCHQLFVPRHRRSMFGRRAFSVAGPAAWNSLYQTTCEIRNVPL